MRVGRNPLPVGTVIVNDNGVIFTLGESFNAGGTSLILMERAEGEGDRGWFLNELLEECAEPASSGAPLRNGGLPSPLVAASIIEQVLIPLRYVHRAGYVHCDINDGNIFLSITSRRRASSAKA